jgi:RNA polymerase sigma-70 factor, ECF subfamily
VTNPIRIFLVAVLLRINLSLSKSWTLVVILLCEESPRIMASFGPGPSRSRDALQSAITRLYKYALVLTVNEELARALLRGTTKALNLRKDFAWDDRDHLIEAFRRMHAMWSAKLTEDPNIQKRCQPEPRLFAASSPKGTVAGNAHFAKFMANMSPSQRAALYLVYGEDMSYDEAAEATALDMLSLMKLLARGHVALSHWLDQRGLSDGATQKGNQIDASPGQERAA